MGAPSAKRKAVPTSARQNSRKRARSSEPAGSSQANPVDIGDSDDELKALSSSNSQHDNAIVLSDNDDDDEEDSAQQVIGSTQANVIDLEQVQLYGTLDTRIVGIQYYRGIATVGEHVLCIREPENKYDRNAIRVDNINRRQIGHIPRGPAAKLSKYLDDRSLFLEARLTGNKGQYDVPAKILLYGTTDMEQRNQLMDRMVKDRLPVDGVKRLRNEEERKRKSDLKQALKQQTGLGMMGSVQQQWQGKDGSNSTAGGDENQSLDDLLASAERYNPRTAAGMTGNFGMTEDVLKAMPLATQPKELRTKLLPYQLQAMKWMEHHEHPTLPTFDGGETVQLWKKTSKATFTNIATSFSQQTEPVIARGGLLCDDMGLGKSLEVIALVATDLANSRTNDAVSNATLILAPVSVMSNWSQQIERHVDPKYALKVVKYYGSNRLSISTKELKEADIVISSYGVLSTEYQDDKKAQAAKKGLFGIDWRRVVLDEGHTIRNPSTKVSTAATALKAWSRWVLTGTPIINTLKDLFSLVRFLGLSGGLARLDIFTSVLIRPLASAEEDAQLLLTALMGAICLRRRKDMSFIDLRLPELSEFIHKVQLKDHEQAKYDAFQKEAQGMLSEYTSTTKSGNGRKAQEAYRHLLEILLRMRQVCNHWQLCNDRVTKLMELLNGKTFGDLDPEAVKTLQQLLQLSIEQQEDCPICLESLNGHEPVITRCAHVFGSNCISRVIQLQNKCPMCRTSLETEEQLIHPARDLGVEESAPDMDEISGVSSKTEALVSILEATARKNDGTKTVIFSQWCRYLDIAERELKERGFHLTRLDGSMNNTKRDAALTRFDNDPECSILLASLSVCAVGLNLVVANQVVLCDSWWAPAIEDQAVDRVHRLGQQKECTVIRLVAENTVEERTLDIQAEKRKLMGRAFGEEVKRGQAKGRLGDIKRLLQ